MTKEQTLVLLRVVLELAGDVGDAGLSIYLIREVQRLIAEVELVQ